MNKYDYINIVEYGLNRSERYHSFYSGYSLFNRLDLAYISKYAQDTLIKAVAISGELSLLDKLVE